MKITAVTTQKNEGAFLLEWIAYHKVIGFSDIVVLSNDCEDGSDELLDQLAENGELIHVRNDGPYDDRGIQFAALKLADKQPEVKDADWIMHLDIDEFLNIHVGDGKIIDLISALPDADAIALTWRMFGNNGIIEFKDHWITDQFIRAAPKTMHWPWRAFMIKTLYRNNGMYGKLGVHRPKQPDSTRVKEAKWYSGSGHALPNAFKTKQLFSDYTQNNYELAQINHYALGAMQSFVLKAIRGRSGSSYQGLNMDYWCDRNFCQEEDKTIQRHALEMRAELERLCAYDNIKELHENSVTWRENAFITAMRDEEYRALMGRLLMTPPSQSMPARFAAQLRKKS